MGIATALIISSVIAAGSSALLSKQESKAAEAQSDRREHLEKQARENEKKIRDAAVDPETATFTFGSDEDDEDEVGSFDEFLSPTKSPSGLGKPSTTGQSLTGLGFNI
jgi:hypothetical protein